MTARRLASALAALSVLCAEVLASAQEPAAPPAYSYPPGPVFPVPPPPPRMERNSTAMMIAGIVMTAVGGAALVSGVFVYGVDTERMCVFAESSQGATVNSGCETHHSVPGIVMMAAGGASLIAGIPLIVIGAQQVPAEPPTGTTLAFRF